MYRSYLRRRGYATYQPTRYDIYKYFKNPSVNFNLDLNRWNFIRDKRAFRYLKIPLSELF